MSFQIKERVMKGGSVGTRKEFVKSKQFFKYEQHELDVTRIFLKRELACFSFIRLSQPFYFSVKFCSYFL
jgi:hypothetical protein